MSTHRISSLQRGPFQALMLLLTLVLAPLTSFLLPLLLRASSYFVRSLERNDVFTAFSILFLEESLLTLVQ